MCETVVAKNQFNKLENSKMHLYFSKLKKLTEVKTLAASAGFFLLSSLYVVHIKIGVLPSQIS